MNADQQSLQQLTQLKDRIAHVYGQRELLKRELELGSAAFGGRTVRSHLKALELADRELFDLDNRYKSLWDATHAKSKTELHPAAAWAMETTFDPIHLDCITAIMLKVLDGKCKMGAAEKGAITAVYDITRSRPGQGLGDQVHAIIASGRAGQASGLKDEIAGAIHAWRVTAESAIPKDVMKNFKKILRTSMPMQAAD